MIFLLLLFSSVLNLPSSQNVPPFVTRLQYAYDCLHEERQHRARLISDSCVFSGAMLTSIARNRRFEKQQQLAL